MSNSKNYYTEAVKVVDLPVYLDEQYINYKLIFFGPNKNASYGEVGLLKNDRVNWC